MACLLAILVVNNFIFEDHLLPFLKFIIYHCANTGKEREKKKKKKVWKHLTPLEQRTGVSLQHFIPCVQPFLLSVQYKGTISQRETKCHNLLEYHKQCHQVHFHFSTLCQWTSPILVTPIKLIAQMAGSSRYPQPHCYRTTLHFLSQDPTFLRSVIPKEGLIPFYFDQ